jgi:hypothetical protein
MQGLRTQEDSKFIAFFTLVQQFASKQNAVFFLDCGEGRDVETEFLSGEDLCGWLIPKENANDFQAEYLSRTISDRWSKFLCFAVWSQADTAIYIDFQYF